jgi:hypothetical protein
MDIYPRPKDVEFYSNAQKQASPYRHINHKNTFLVKSIRKSLNGVCPHKIIKKTAVL